MCPCPRRLNNINMSKEKPYRPCVGVALFNDKGQVFVGERIDTPGAWQMPQGGIERDEDIKKAALRELKEEIGTDKAQWMGQMAHPLTYDFPPDTLAQFERQGRDYLLQFKGQEQFWTAFRFTGADSDIDLAADDHPEFSKWQWVDLDKTIDLIVPFKRDVYERVIEAFAQYAE